MDEGAAPVTLFYSYAHEDEPLRDELQGHLKLLERRGLLAPWHDRKISPGADWAAEIDANLERAELVLLLVSKDFIESDYIIGVELAAAMQRHAQRSATVVPVIVRAVDIDPEDADVLPFMKLQGLPTDLKPVTSWANRDEAWTNVAKGLRATVKEIRARRPALPAAPASLERAPSAASKAVPAAVPAAIDPLLDRLVGNVAQQIDAAQHERGAAALDPGALRTLQQGTRALIDVPDQKRVLWVDDRPEGNRFEVAALAHLQIEVVAVRSTDEAMQTIAADREGFDLVISDWERHGEPAQAGLRLLARLREAGRTLPLVYYHFALGEQRAERAVRAQAGGALGEAVQPAELMALVARALA